MKNLFWLSLGFLLLLVAGCNKEQIVNADENFQELTIVQAEIHPNANFPGVRITKTLPVQTPYSITAAEITDAVVYLRIDSVKIVPLHYTYEGLYRPLYNLPVSEGELYELFGRIGTRTFYSKTHIPYKPVIQSSHYNLSENYAEGVTLARENEVYSALWVVNGQPFIRATEFFDLSIPTTTLVTSTINVRSAAFPTAYRSDTYRWQRCIQIFAFDKAYEKYFKTKSASQEVGSPYTGGAGKTEWNISGDNFIGMFIGTAESDVVNVQ